MFDEWFDEFPIQNLDFSRFFQLKCGFLKKSSINDFLRNPHFSHFPRLIKKFMKTTDLGLEIREKIS